MYTHIYTEINYKIFNIKKSKTILNSFVNPFTGKNYLIFYILSCKKCIIQAIV